MSSNTQQQERAEAVEQLRAMIDPGDTVWTILRHVSQSGMSRSISLMVVDEDGDPMDISWLAARAMGDKIDQRHDGIKVSGCGMDMGFDLVYGLSSVLFRDGYECLEPWKRCPSNFHENNSDKSVTEPFHTDGYAIKHRWF